MGDETFEDRLQQIWQQGHRSMAAAFLRRAMTPQTTLADVAKALQFDAVRDFLGSLKLSDVLREAAAARLTGPGPAAEAPTAPSRAAAPSAAPDRKRRRRRGPAQMAEIKEEIRQMLVGEPGSLDTTQMHETLKGSGHDIDRLTLNRLLTQLEEEGHVTCLGGRPKSWRSSEGKAAMAAGQGSAPTRQEG